jgi:hypothetical protein
MTIALRAARISRLETTADLFIAARTSLRHFP